VQRAADTETKRLRAQIREMTRANAALQTKLARQFTSKRGY
jgi:hypothetical protein